MTSDILKRLRPSGSSRLIPRLEGEDSPFSPEGVKKLDSAVTPVKTGVQSIAKALKTLDSGFRRNDAKKKQIDFFTPSPFERRKGGISKISAGDIDQAPSNILINENVALSKERT